MVVPDRRSLTLRLTLLFGAMSTVVLVLTGCAFYLSLGHHFLHEDAIELHGKIELLGNLVRRLGTDRDVPALTDRLEDALVGHHNLALDLAAPDGRIVFSDAAMPAAVRAAANTTDAADLIDGLAIESIAAEGHQYRVTRFTLATRLPSMPELRATLAMNVDHHQAFMARVRDTTVLSVLIGALLAGFLGWVTARIGLAPLRGLVSLASRTSAERLDARVRLDDLPPELVPLGESFNAMLERLENSFRRLKEFSSDLAHELRTPISALRTQVEVALSRPRSAAEYREVLYSAMEEYERLARMIGDMLFLARSDHGLMIPQRAAVDLRAEVLALYEFYDALVESRQVRLEVTGSATVDGDRLMIRRALGNLLSNAIRHARTGSVVTTELSEGPGDRVLIALTNIGDPIAEEHLPRLFDRFYRVDPARSRASEGAGLGLAITKSIVEAHGGTIVATSTGGTTRFAVELPVALPERSHITNRPPAVTITEAGQAR